MLFKISQKVGLFLVLISGLLFWNVSSTFAITREEINARRAQRIIEREERDAKREARRNESNEQVEEINEEAQTCSCSSRLSLARPDLQWRSGILTFVPRVNIAIRTRGDQINKDWAVNLKYQGSADFNSDDVAVPNSLLFKGTKHIQSGQCGDNNYSYSGLALPEISLNGILKNIFGLDQKLAGNIKLDAIIEGCGFEQEDKQFGLEVEDLGNLSIGNWRRVR